MGISINALAGCKIRFNLHGNRGGGRTLPQGHPAAVSAHTIFPTRVMRGKTILQPGWHSSKLGGEVLKGRWKGMPIYSLTLEERATCPRDCAQWFACFGNNMHLAKRNPHGPEFETALWRELHALNQRHRKGFVVRLHVLGDFMSASYVDLWEAALDHFENLNVFGYTARQSSTVIGRMIRILRSNRWERFSVRTSGAQKGLRTSVVDQVEDAPRGSVVCPAQTGRTRSCGTCGLCWNSKKHIVFLKH